MAANKMRSFFLSLYTLERQGVHSMCTWSLHRQGKYCMIDVFSRTTSIIDDLVPHGFPSPRKEKKMSNVWKAAHTPLFLTGRPVFARNTTAGITTMLLRSSNRRQAGAQAPRRRRRAVKVVVVEKTPMERAIGKLRPHKARGWSDSNANLLTRARASGSGSTEFQYSKNDELNLEIVQAARVGTSGSMQKRLVADEHDDFADTLRAAAHAFVVEKSCAGNNINAMYVYTIMVSKCTHAVVAFRERAPVGFALLDKSHARQTELLLLCAAASAQGTGKVLLGVVSDEAQVARRKVTLSAVASVMSYYAANGFALGENCNAPLQLQNGKLVTTRLKRDKDGKYNYTPIAPLITELHHKKLAPNKNGVCGKSDATFEQLTKADCILDGYRMLKCPSRRDAAQVKARVSAAREERTTAKAEKAKAEKEKAEKAERAEEANVAKRANAAKAKAEAAKAEAAKAVAEAVAEAERAKVAKAAAARPEAVAKAAAARPEAVAKAHAAKALPRQSHAVGHKKPQFVSKRELLAPTADGANERWRRRSRDGTTAVVSRVQLVAELEKKRAARERRTTLEKHGREERRRLRGKCASATAVRAERNGNGRVCSGNRVYGNHLRLSAAELKAKEAAYALARQQGLAKRERLPGKCASARAVRASPDANLRVCSGSHVYGNHLRLTTTQLREKENKHVL